jgi:hypothetical protein
VKSTDYGTPNNYYGDQIKEDEMGEACSAHGEMINANKIWLVILKRKEHPEELGVDERTILK